MRGLTRLFKYFLGLVGLFVVLQALVRLFRRLVPFPVPAGVARVLDLSAHELGQARQQTLGRIGLKPGMKVLELGAGQGFLTIEAAHLVGPDGRLVAVDISRELLDVTAEKVQQAGLQNVDLQVASTDCLPFPAGTFDLAYMATMLGAIADKGRALREIRRVLKPNGRLSITEAIADPDYMLMAEVVGWANLVGFELVEQQGNALLYTLNFVSLIGP